MRTLLGSMIEWKECSFEYEEYTLAHPLKRITVSIVKVLIAGHLVMYLCTLCCGWLRCLNYVIAPFEVI